MRQPFLMAHAQHRSIGDILHDALRSGTIEQRMAQPGDDFDAALGTELPWTVAAARATPNSVQDRFDDANNDEIEPNSDDAARTKYTHAAITENEGNGTEPEDDKDYEEDAPEGEGDDNEVDSGGVGVGGGAFGGGGVLHMVQLG